MNWLDISLLCLAGIGLVKGLFDGAIKQVVSLIAIGAAIYFCTKAATFLKVYILELGWFSKDVSSILSYIFGFVLILGIVVLVGEIVNKVIDVTPLSLLNHLGGGVLGVLIMLFFVSLTFNFLEIVDKKSSLISHEVKVESQFYGYVKELLPTIYPDDLFIEKD
jgi:Uncharacterized membrane protein, required for colicin V production